MANQTQQLAELLKSAGAAVSIVQVNPPFRPASVAKIPILRALFRLVAYAVTLWRVARRSDLLHVMANSGWSWHLFAAPAIWIAHARGVPVVVNYRGGEAARFLEQSAAIVRWSMRRAALLAVPSGFLQRVFAAHGMSSSTVPNIVDLARFGRRGDRVPGSAHVVVCRHLEAIYDNETALRAFVQLRTMRPEAAMTMAGSGPEADRLRSLAKQLGIAAAVRFAGALGRDEMAELYRRADVVLNPSRVDNMPNSLLEAMASGVPLVSTNVGGIPFVVVDGVTALLVEPGDATAMALACQRVLSDAALWQRLSDAGVTEVQRYAWPRIAPALAGIYRTVLAGGRR